MVLQAGKKYKIKNFYDETKNNQIITIAIIKSQRIILIKTNGTWGNPLITYTNNYDIRNYLKNYKSIHNATTLYWAIDTINIELEPIKQFNIILNN